MCNNGQQLWVVSDLGHVLCVRVLFRRDKSIAIDDQVFEGDRWLESRTISIRILHNSNERFDKAGRSSCVLMNSSSKNLRMDAAKEGNVSLFLELTDCLGQSKQSRILQRTRQIFRSQKTFLFGSDEKEELRAALREATAIENCECNGHIAREAATEKVLQLAESIRDLHKDSLDREFHVNEFIRAAYDIKCMFRSVDLDQENQVN